MKREEAKAETDKWNCKEIWMKPFTEYIINEYGNYDRPGN